MPRYAYTSLSGYPMPMVFASITGPDGVTKRKSFLVDSGAAITVIPSAWCSVWYAQNAAAEVRFAEGANGTGLRGVPAFIDLTLDGLHSAKLSAWVCPAAPNALLGQSGIFKIFGVVFHNFRHLSMDASFTVFRRPRAAPAVGR